MPLCGYCKTVPAVLKRPKTGDVICKTCFLERFEFEVHTVIIENSLFTRGERVAVCASGGKDSTVLCHVLVKLNSLYNYGLDLFMLSIDEGISGYRDDSLQSVQKHREDYQIELAIVSYESLYGWSMDSIVKQIGRNNNCTFCGVFRRQAIDRGAIKMKATKVVTGHNADDMAETVLMNLLRGDIARLDRSVSIMTGDSDSPLPRVKPFKYCYEKEIVMYAYYAQLQYFSTECIYSPFAYRGYARELIKDLERVEPNSIINIIRSGEELLIKEETKKKRANNGKGSRGSCQRCGYMSSNPICKACVMLQGLNEKKNSLINNNRTSIEMEKEEKEAVGVEWRESIDVTNEEQREQVARVFAALNLSSPASKQQSTASPASLTIKKSTVATHGQQNTTQW